MALTKTGTGTLTLSGANIYTGVTTINSGTLQIGSGGATGSIAGNIVDNARLVFSRNDTPTYAGVISGPGTVTQAGPGTLILSGISTYTGATTVSNGTLEVDGTLGNTAITVQSGATLSGKGTVTGNVAIQAGGNLTPLIGTQTLTLGPLSLSSTSNLNYQLSTPGVLGSGANGLINVNGNMTLGGILNVTNGGGFGSGSYELINYTGTRGGASLTLGSLPLGFTAANVSVTTSVAHQVNLVVNSTASPTQFWNGTVNTFDGVVHGGTGFWENLNTNFLDAGVSESESWNEGFAVFTAGTAPETVTLQDDIIFQGIQFANNGYTIAGGGFTLQPTAPI